MAEAYLFAAVEAGSPDEALKSVLRSSGVRAAWVNEVHWLGQPLPAALASKALFGWPDAPLLALFSLQALLRALQNGAADLLVLGESTSQGAAALLLGSPAAVGRWNLPPLARLEPIPLNQPFAEAIIAGLAAQAAARLEDTQGGALGAPDTQGGPAPLACPEGQGVEVPEEAGETLALAACTGLAKGDLQAAFPGTALRAGDGLRAAAGLVRELVNLRARYALLAGFAGQGGLGLWIERL
jgi:hypothetical protein